MGGGGGACPEEGLLNGDGENRLEPPADSGASLRAMSEALLCMLSSSSTASIKRPAKRKCRGDEYRIMWNDTQLITSINNWNTRRVREAIEIHRHDTIPQDPGLHINNIWIPLLQQPSPTHATSPASATAPEEHSTSR